METNENMKKNNGYNQEFDVINNVETRDNTGVTNEKKFDFDATQRIDFLGELIKNNEIGMAKSNKEEQENETVVQSDSIEQDELSNESKIEKNDSEIINVQNFNPEINENPIAQEEKLSEISNENVQKNPKEINEIEEIEMQQNNDNAEITENNSLNVYNNEIEELIEKNEDDGEIIEDVKTIDNIKNEKMIEDFENISKDENVNNIENISALGNFDNIENKVDKENVEIEKIDKNTENDKIEEYSEDVLKIKEKQHAQDKKDYRLERMLFERINKMQGKIKESLELIKKFERINAREENLPNIVTTLHDKLTQEVIKQFRTVGIEFNMNSYLVQSVVSDLLAKFAEGITEFKDCSENLNFVREVQEDFESRVELAPTSKVKNIFARLRGMFKPERKQEKLEELERERQEKKLEEANIHLIKYKFINNELERYTIKKNIVGSLKREIIHGQNSGVSLSWKDFIDQKIQSEMQKLGLEDSVNELENSIYEEYKNKNNEIGKEEFEELSISQIRNGIKIQKIDNIRSKIHDTVMSNDIDDEEEMAI